MKASGSVYSSTLQELTNIKLDELSKKRSKFEEEKASILSAVQALQGTAVDRLNLLSHCVKKCFALNLNEDYKVVAQGEKYTPLETHLQNLDRFLSQAQYDPSISAKMLDAWHNSLLRHLDEHSLKYQYATICGQLVTEWLSGENAEPDSAADDVEMGDAFEDVGNALKLEARKTWEETVFEPARIDKRTLTLYLDSLFGVGKEDKKPVNDALSRLRDEVRDFQMEMATPSRFDASTLSWVIQGLKASDLLSNEMREVLGDLEGNNIMLNEIADVLNMRISALDSWTWSADAPVSVEMRRKISGKYDVHMHEDLLQAIFLHYIGVKWSVFLKDALRGFRCFQGAWKSRRRSISKLEKQRFEYYLGAPERYPSLQGARTKMYNKKFFMAQLMGNVRQVTDTADGEEEAEFEQFTHGGLKRRAKEPARKPTGGFSRKRFVSAAARKSAPSGPICPPSPWVEDENEAEDDVDDPVRNPMDLKQTLLHLLSTEIIINTRLRGEVTAFHSVFESWSNRLPHETILTVLGFFGVSQTWLEFFQKFLEAPLKFVDDAKADSARQRRRGTPTSHVLSDVFGEATLFCLDLAVNQSTSGSTLWRVHDDLWFWSHDQKKAVAAWETVKKFAAVTGTELNRRKSGTVRVSKDPEKTLPVDESLPDGAIRWGFLYLSHQSGQFEIDQVMVDSHINELQKQLQTREKSIFAFIQAWNSYAGVFFTSNFGKPAACFGRQHVNDMLSTHERIQRQIFNSLTTQSDTPVSSTAGYLKQALRRRFGVEDIPDGFLFFPMELGGLDLQSPFASLLQIRDVVPPSPKNLLDSYEKEVHETYERAMTEFMDGSIRRWGVEDPDWVPETSHDRETFMSFEEFVRYREEFEYVQYEDERRLQDIFKELMERPAERSIAPDESIEATLSHLRGQSNLRGITDDWSSMEPYWRWIAMMYGPEIVDRFGGMNIVDPGLLPMGMVTLFRDRRVKWQG